MVEDLLVKPSEQGTPPSDVEKLEKQQDQKEEPRMTWETMTATAAASVERDSGEILPLPPPSDEDGKPRSNEMETDVSLDSGGDTGNGVVKASEKNAQVNLDMDMIDENRRRLLLGLPGKIPFEEVSWEGENEEGMLVEKSQRHLRHKNSSKRRKAAGAAPTLEDYDSGGHVEVHIEGRTEEGRGDDRDGLTRRDDGVGVSGIGVSEGDILCDSSFPLSTTLVAWASCFVTLIAYRLLPSYRPELTADD